MKNERHPRYRKGQRIAGQYLVHQALMGGMGEVYLCLDEQEIAPVALKTFQGSSPDLADIFKKEVSNWIALEKHPNIVQCFWMQKLDNIPFMALEWVAGEEGKGTDLRSWLRRGPLDLMLALKFTIDIVRGLQHAQQKSPGIVHRDLKPDNILVNQSRQAKITDFGLAKVIQDASLEVLQPGDAVAIPRYSNMGGTHWYMAPEQWLGYPMDFRTDLYAVGCVLYELLTGHWPYDGCTVSELRAQHLEAPLPEVRRDFPITVQKVLGMCLAKRIQDRYERIDILLDELTQLYETRSGERLNPVSAEILTVSDYSNRGITLNSLGRLEEALRDHDQAIALDPSNARAYYNRGVTLSDMGRLEESLDNYSRAIVLDPAYSQAYTNRGNTLHSLGRLKEALANYNQAIRLDPTDAVPYSNRGGTFYDIGRFEDALVDNNQAIRLNPTYSQAYTNRGNTLYALGQLEEALADYSQAVTLDPNDAVAYINLGTFYARSGQLNQALPYFERAAMLGHPAGVQYAAQARQDLGVPSVQPQPDEQEQVMIQLVDIYRQIGESGLRAFLLQNNIPVSQINEIVTIIKQITGA